MLLVYNTQNGIPVILCLSSIYIKERIPRFTVSWLFIKP